MTRHINIAVITPSAVVFAGLSGILNRLDGMNVNIHHAEADCLDELVNSHHVSVIIIDVLSGHIDEVGRLHASSDNSDTQFILFSSVRVPDSMTRIFDATISLYDTESDIRRTVTETLRNSHNSDTPAELTAREREIIIAVVRGLSNKEIASCMNISVNTVMTHRRNIAAKLQIHSAAGLTIYAITTKLVDIGSIR